jgi:polyhydroxybutyrate depolymerase
VQALALGLGGGLALGACSSDSPAGPASPGTPNTDDAGTGDDEAGTTDDATPPDLGPTCGAAGVKPGATSQSLMVGTSKRTYELFLPSSYDNHRTFPLVLVFHGDGGTGAGIRASFPLEAAAAGGAIFAYPDGESATWQIDTADGVTTDIAFIDALAAELAKTHCTDPKHVSAVGFSKGAYFVDQYACLGKTPLRAVVAHSGGGPFGVTGLATKYDDQGNLVCPDAPIPAMQIIGQADDLLTEAQKARDYWEHANGCKTTSSATAPSPCVSYDGCTAGLPEIYCEIPGLGHQIWPAAPKTVWTFVTSR